MKVTLLDEKLQFISLGTGTIHARETGPYRWNPALDLATITMCGQKIPASFGPKVERSLPTDKLCRRCLSSLRTYSGGAKRLYSPARVTFEYISVEWEAR